MRALSGLKVVKIPGAYGRYRGERNFSPCDVIYVFARNLDWTKDVTLNHMGKTVEKGAGQLPGPRLQLR